MFSFLGFATTTNLSHDGIESTEEQSQKNKPVDPSSQDSPPLFPAQNSIQRASASLPTSSSPQPHPSLRFHSPDDEEDEEDEEDHPDHLDHFDIDTLEPPHSTRQKPPKPRKKVQLMPGFSQLDWAKLKSSGINLRGESVTSIRRITRGELGKHKTKEDAWSSFNGKVYNITAYLNYHPGGARELLRVAGKDGTELFMKTHAWISVDGMLDSCLVGFLVND